MTTHKDTDLHEALRRKYADTPQLPADFSDRLMQRLEQQDTKPKRHRVWLYPAVGVVAASLLLLLTLYHYNNVATKKQPLAEKRIAHQRKVEKPVKPQAKEQELAHCEMMAQKPPVQPPLPITATPTTEEEQTSTYTNEQASAPADNNLHYAKHETADTTYQKPSRMEDFIVKLADYHQVKGERLECSSDKADSTIVCIAYVFEDKEEQNLFGRLLQAACWYDSKTPGYLLNYSYLQFFFCLKDLQLGLKYLWIAERVNGRILLYSTHSPIDAEVSSECFHNYRDKLTHTSIHQKTKAL
ncbi:MAG: hypothetical protein K2H92_03550 [Bacteroidaceae bacterium]|nr:hypothetical protein [Bacteroidaceae bacterium]